MLLEVKTKVKRHVDDSVKCYSETYLTDVQFFSEAEYAVMDFLHNDNTVESFDVQSIKVSPIKELYHIEDGENTYIATLIDSFTDDCGNVKSLRYKVLLWADSLTQANQRTQNFAREGYDMTVESLTAKPIIYLNGN